MVKTRVIRLLVGIEGPNARDQIAFFAFLSFLVKSKGILATYKRRDNLEIRIVGSSSRPQQLMHKYYEYSNVECTHTLHVVYNGLVQVRKKQTMQSKFTARLKLTVKNKNDVYHTVDLEERNSRCRTRSRSSTADLC